MKKAFPVASATDYIEHARALNFIARSTLRLETRDSTLIAAKISIGLSLQAMELVAKGILCSLGYPREKLPEKIQNAYRYHDILTLLMYAQEIVNNVEPKEKFLSYRYFLLATPKIGGKETCTTIQGYLKEHFSRGIFSKSRNYFYPDAQKFTVPEPIYALSEMAEHLINVAEQVEAVAQPVVTTQ